MKDETQIMSLELRAPLRPGDPAPRFSLPAVNRDGLVSLDDYRDKSPLLLSIFRGLYCAFCRRHIAQLAGTREKQRAAGVETLAIVATPVERARLYLRFRPTKVLLAADPEMVTHRSYSLPKVQVDSDAALRLKSMYLDLAREMNEPLPATASVTDLVNTVARLDGFDMTQADWDDRERHLGQKAGQFLLHRHGVVRWVNWRARGMDPRDSGSSQPTMSSWPRLGRCRAKIVVRRTLSF
jgi:peroxiredoxin